MKDSSNNESYGIIFFVLLIFTAVLIVAFVRNHNIKTMEALDKEYVHGRLITLGADTEVIKSTSENAISTAREAKETSNKALSKALPNSERLDVLEKRLAALESKSVPETPRYVSLAYCLATYNNITGMMVLSCKEYPKR
jgi:hypothetical protein